MAWTNAFDIGPCNVVVNDGTTDIFNGTIGQGETSSVFSSSPSGRTFSVTVTSDGQVALNQLSGNTSFSGYLMTVVPSYLVDAASMRASAFTIPNGISGNASAYSSNDGVVQVKLTGSDATWTPDPADISEAGFQAFWAVYMGELV